jgi:hypothetical protein
MALASMLKSVGINPEDIETARQQAGIVRQFIEQTNRNTEALVARLTAIDTGLSAVRETMHRQDAMLHAIRGALAGVAQKVDQVHAASDLDDNER